MTASKSFRATPVHGGPPLNWIIVRVPFDVARTWGKRGQMRVKGEVNGFGFRTSLFPTGDGRHYFIFNKKMQKGGRAAPGHVAEFRLQPDSTPRPVAMPPELDKILQKERALRRWYERLNPSMRKDICGWVGAGKQTETRRRRAEQLAVRMMETMEAERELPPLIRLALAREPRASEGWELMSVAQRRQHLLGIFYYRTPEARARRVAKVVDVAAEKAQKKGN